MTAAENFAQIVASASPDEDCLLLAWEQPRWQRLFAAAQPRVVQPMEMIIQRGQTDRTVYFVLSGLFEVGSVYVDGVSMSPLAKIGTGSVLGEQSFFDGMPRSTNVWAATEGRLMALDYPEFEAFGIADPEGARDLAVAMARVLSVRLRHTTVRIRR